jgi:hypothetical protein
LGDLGADGSRHFDCQWGHFEIGEGLAVNRSPRGLGRRRALGYSRRRHAGDLGDRGCRARRDYSGTGYAPGMRERGRVVAFHGMRGDMGVATSLVRTAKPLCPLQTYRLLPLRGVASCADRFAGVPLRGRGLGGFAYTLARATMQLGNLGVCAADFPATDGAISPSLAPAVRGERLSGLRRNDPWPRWNRLSARRRVPRTSIFGSEATLGVHSVPVTFSTQVFHAIYGAAGMHVALPSSRTFTPPGTACFYRGVQSIFPAPQIVRTAARWQQERVSRMRCATHGPAARG